MAKALVCAPLAAQYRQKLETMAELTFAGWGGPDGIRADFLTSEEITKIGQDAEIIILGPEAMTGEMLHALPNLQVIACSRSGTEGIDVTTATKLGIAVLNAPGRNAIAVAEFTFALLLELCRMTSKGDKLVRSGEWAGWLTPLDWGLEGIELAGQVMGLIGLGSIGRLVALRAKAFEMHVIAYDPYIENAVFSNEYIKSVSLDDLLRSSDFVSIHCSLNPETRNMLDVNKFLEMKPTAYLINTARAAVVEEQALISALEKGIIAGAALDVFWDEPLSKHHPLRDYEKVILTPHIAGLTNQVVEHGSKLIVDGVENYLMGKIPKNIVNPEVHT